jgi:hypothetical protein
MRHTQAFLLIPLLFVQRQCGMVSPDAIKGKVEEALRPYFPKAQGVVVPQQQAIMGLTCSQGVGPGLVEKMQTYIAGDREINQQLGMVRFAPLLGGAHYRYFVLVFDGGMVRYDLDARKVEAVGMTPQALEIYDQACGL